MGNQAAESISTKCLLLQKTSQEAVHFYAVPKNSNHWKFQFLYKHFSQLWAMHSWHFLYSRKQWPATKVLVQTAWLAEQQQSAVPSSWLAEQQQCAVPSSWFLKVLSTPARAVWTDADGVAQAEISRVTKGSGATRQKKGTSALEVRWLCSSF